MKTAYSFYLFLSLLVAIACDKNHTSNVTEDSTSPKPRKIDNDNFTGTAWLTMIAVSDSLNGMYAGQVRFEPGAYTNWHSHPAGQLLIVTDGIGYYQEKGQSKRILKKGDAVKCAPNVPHWHGAAPTAEFTHIAVSSSEKGPTIWLEPVSEKDYIN